MKQKKEKPEINDLEEAIAEIKQRFGEGAIMSLKDVRAVDVDAIPTGSVSLDLAVGVGGVPRGRVIEIFGPESSGKSTLALHICAEAQKKGGIAAFVDAEHALDPDYAKKIGVKVEDLLISQPDSGEQALQIVETLIRSSSIDVIVVDSVAALTPKSEIAGEIGDASIGVQARLMSQALRKLASIVAKSKTLVIFLNQTRMKIGVMFGNPETTSGGLALKFYASVRIDLRRIAQIKQGEEIVGSMVRAKIVKNKVAAPFRTAEFAIYYNEGISYLADIINTGIKNEVIKKAGSWLQFEDTKLGQGIDGAKKFLKENPAVVKKIRAKLDSSLS
ncbi:MAG: recombinase RecA [Candidatus Nealsonbacteria bacterium]|nr:recombinase RecA [Candidatus Nealsonbacteria bacterium]